MSCKQFIVLSLSLSLAQVSSVSSAGAQYAGLEQARQAQIEALKKAAEEKAASEASSTSSTSSDTSSDSGSSTSAEPPKPPEPKVAPPPPPKKDDQEAKDKKAQEEKEGEEKDEKKGKKKSSKGKKGDGEETAEGEGEGDSETAEGEEADDKKAKGKDEKKPAAANVYHPLKDAMFAINIGKYNDSLNILNQVLVKDANNAQAIYLLAFTYVMLRKYPEAAEQYRKVLKLAPNSKIGKLAAEGLNKIVK